MLPISLVITTYNEEKTIELLLQSIEAGNEIPTEVIIVDAGSTDLTVEKINDQKSKMADFEIRILNAGRVNRSVGRNIGVKAAKNNWIAVTDAGCAVAKDWLKELWRKVLNKQYDEPLSVAGWYSCAANTKFQKMTEMFLAVTENNFDETNFLPSSRSLLFNKVGFLAAGMYPEKLNTCEDLVFAENLKLNSTMIVCKQARVTWFLPDNLNDFFKTVAGYAEGDVRARYIRHVKKILLTWVRWILLVGQVEMGLMIVLGYPIVKYGYKKLYLTKINWLEYLGIHLVCDLATMWGSLRGVFSSHT